MIGRFTPLAFGLVLTLGGVAEAQRGADAPNPRQRALAGQVRKAFSDVVRKHLALNDEQSKRLTQVDNRFQKERNSINQDERAARQGLRAVLEDSVGTPDQAKVDGYLTQLVRAQRRRADVLEAEQKELATFLTPVQRAKYFALRDQLTRRINQLGQERGRGARQGGAPPHQH